MSDNRLIQATTGDKGSWASLFNPISGFTDSIDRYPKFMSGLTGSDRGDWLLSKAGAIGLLALATAGGIRLVKHLKHMSAGKDKDNPAYKIGEQIGTTFNPELPKTASVVYKPDSSSMENITNVALPLLAAGALSYAGWRGMDKELDDMRSQDLDTEIADKQDVVNRLIRARAKLAKGTIKDADVEKILREAGDKSQYVHKPALEKQAKGPKQDESFWNTGVRGSVTFGGLALLALAGLSGYAGYKYVSKIDEDNDRYDAVKKGLKEYVKWKNINAPINITPVDPEKFFAGIDDDGDSKRSARVAPAAVESRGGISITL